MRKTILPVALTLAPFVFSSLAVVSWAGWDGVMMPYRFHITRSFNGESTYDVLFFFIRQLGIRTTGAEQFVHDCFISKILMILSSIMGALIFPKNVRELAESWVFALVGFISFSLFHSPQYFLWPALIAGFSTNRLLLWSVVAYCWATYLYCPIGEFLHGFPLFYNLSILPVIVIQFWILGVILYGWRGIRRYA